MAGSASPDAQTWIVLLRGINVGGRNRLPMAELRRRLEALAAASPRTYLQSGNAVVRSSPEIAGRLTADLPRAIEAAHGFKPWVLVLSHDALDVAMAANPFPEARGRELHLYFLCAEPGVFDIDQLEAVRRPNERYRLNGKVFYLHAPDGIGRSKLAGRVERVLGVESTARNRRTVEALLKLAAPSGSAPG
ncbi:MAG: DUF1697 domain-containing protein [Acidobacteriota bacterium]